MTSDKRKYDTHNLRDIVCRVIAIHLGISYEIVEDSSSLASLGADSLDEVEVMMAIEERLNLGDVPFPAEEEPFPTIGDICKYYEKRIKEFEKTI